MQVKPKFPICLLISLTIAGEKSKSLSTIQTSLSTSENKLAVKNMLGDLDKNLARFEEELGSRREKDQNQWMIEGMYSALDINVGVFLHYLRCIGLLHQLLMNKPALSHLWEGVMRRPNSLEVCQAGVAMMETSGRADVVGGLLAADVLLARLEREAQRLGRHLRNSPCRWHAAQRSRKYSARSSSATGMSAPSGFHPGRVWVGGAALMAPRWIARRPAPEA